MPNNLAFRPLLRKLRPSMAASHFRLGINAAGWWVICEATGRRGGMFRTREAAIKYARDESRDGNFTIVHEPDGLEFGANYVGRVA